jgi:transposase
VDRRRDRQSTQLVRQGYHRGSRRRSTAIIQPWSNGQTEGQITKLKLVKRQMYGRAKIDLLEARVIGADGPDQAHGS